MKISTIYKKYKIMPQLQLHMLRVTGIASIICDNFNKSLDKNSTLSTCLIHDIGNIVKFQLEKFPEGLKPKGLNYWTQIQKEFIKKYGKNDYLATYKILEEVRVPKNILGLVKSNEFAKMNSISKHNDFEQKICIYSDARVSPFGIVSLSDRLSEVKERYMKNKNVTERFYEQLSNSALEIEKQISSLCKIKPEDITEEKVKPLINELKEFNIETI